MTPLRGIAIVQHPEHGPYALAPDDVSAEEHHKRTGIATFSPREIRDVYEKAGGKPADQDYVGALIRTKRILGGQVVK
jgi:hypothetical protein